MRSFKRTQEALDGKKLLARILSGEVKGEEAMTKIQRVVDNKQGDFRMLIGIHEKDGTYSVQRKLGLGETFFSNMENISREEFENGPGVFILFKQEED